MSLIKPDQFQTALLGWHQQLCQHYHDETNDDEPLHVALDGNTARGSYCNLEKSDAIHIVSAWATEHGITLGQTEVDSKSNEITAIPELLDFIDISNSIVTIDAIGAQKEIAKKITGAEGDYIFAVKDNHRKFADAI